MIQKVGVVGAGVMGTGLAQNLAGSGLKVILVDRKEEILQNAEKEIANKVRLYSMLKKLSAHDEIAKMQQNITYTTDYNELSESDFVIENATEKWDIKKEIYPLLDRVCREHCVFAANTSAIPITRLGSLTQRPSQVLGMHFMNPVPVKSTVEVIRAYHTSEETLQIANSLLEAMGKKGIMVNDAPGFVSNRVLMLTINEAAFLLQDQVATPEDVDDIFKQCFGHPMGPLETADLIGLDTILYSIEVLYENFNDSKYRPCPLLKKMVDAGLHGRKNGRGFYTY